MQLTNIMRVEYFTTDIKKVGKVIGRGHTEIWVKNGKNSFDKHISNENIWVIDGIMHTVHEFS